MTSCPLVSFLLSCHNGEKWLGESLNSIASQSYSEFEAILIDDGSTDNSRDLLEAFAKNDSRFSIFAKKQSGLPDSLNFGLSMSTGTWVARLDQDDTCSRDRIEQQIDAVSREKGCVLVGSWFFVHDEVSGHKRLVRVRSSHNHLVKRLETMRSFFPHSSAFFNRGAALKVGGYRPALSGADDWDLWLRLSEIGKMTVVQKPLVTIRIHADQMTAINDGKNQVLDAYLSSTAHFIRVSGGIDPLSDSESSSSSRLRDLVQQRLQLKMVFEFVSVLRSHRIIDGNHVGAFAGLMSLVVLLRRNKLLKLAVWHRLCGSKIPKSVAKVFLNELVVTEIITHLNKDKT